MRVRYITCGCVSINDSICSFRLISNAEFRNLSMYVGKTYYKVKIPNDMELIKYSCDSYYTTEDTRTLGELGVERYILDNNLKPVKIDPNMGRTEEENLRSKYLSEYLIKRARKES